VIMNGLDRAAVDMAIEHLVLRHESLRTCIREVNGEIMQCIFPYSRQLFMPSYHDIRGHSDGKEAISRVIEDGKRQLRELDCPPLLRSSLFRISETSYFFCLLVHHIIFDEWSKMIVQRELALFYESFRNGITPQIEPPVMQLKDYAAWQREWLRTNRQRIHEYWMKKLSFLHAGVTRQAIDDRLYVLDHTAAESYTYYITQPLYDRLKALARHCRSNILSVLNSSIRLLFYLLKGNGKALLATVVVARGRPGTESIIGQLMGGAYLYQPVPGEMMLRDFIMAAYLEILQSSQNLIYNHEELGLDERVLRYHTDVFVNFVGTEMGQEISVPEDGAEGVWSAEKPIYYAMSYNMTECRNGIFCIWKYNLRLYSRETILTLIKLHRELLERMCDDPVAPIGKLLKEEDPSAIY